MSREQAIFRKSKTPIMAKYVAEHTTLMSEVAGRGFSKMPGYAFDAENMLELSAKLNLSDVNMKILEETINRELKQAGVDYDISFRSAAITWELEKQSLMTAWDSELAGIKKGMAEEEETLRLLAIEVSRRAITLSEAKTALDLQMEAYRKTLAELDSAVAPHEVQLANAKLLTAQKKVEIIPILEEILTKEQELLVLEQQKATEYTTYMEAESNISGKLNTLKPYLNELATKKEQLAAKISDVQIPAENRIADEKILQSQAEVTKAGYQILEHTADVQTENKRIELLAANRSLNDLKHEHDEGVVTHEKSLTVEYQNELQANFNGILADERSNAATLISMKNTAETTRNATKLTSVNILGNAEMDTDDRIADYEIDKIQKIANAQAAANITSALRHIIS